MDPGGPCLSEGLCLSEGIIPIDIHSRALPLLEAHHLAANEVDGRKENHEHPSPA